MHGDKSQGQRERALKSFAAGKIDTLVATDVAARGIDVEEITHVINFDAPGDRDAYVHRVGRSGRAGRDGAGISFVLPDQGDEMRRSPTASVWRASSTASARVTVARTETAGRTKTAGRPATPLPRRGATVATAATGVATAAARGVGGAAGAARAGAGRDAGCLSCWP